MKGFLRSIVAEQWPFIVPYACFLLFGAAWMMTHTKGDMNLYFHCHRSLAADIYFSSATHLAEALVTIFILVILLMYRYSQALNYLVNMILVGVVTYILKVHVFNINRPVIYFENFLQLEPVRGIALLRYYSFPSGHSTFAFSSFFLCSLFMKDKRMSLLFFILSLSCGISRIYLEEHFFQDVYFGSMIGLCCAGLTYGLFYWSGYIKKQAGLALTVKKRFNND